MLICESEYKVIRQCQVLEEEEVLDGLQETDHLNLHPHFDLQVKVKVNEAHPQGHLQSHSE